MGSIPNQFIPEDILENQHIPNYWEEITEENTRCMINCMKGLSKLLEVQLLLFLGCLIGREVLGNLMLALHNYRYCYGGGMFLFLGF